MKGHLYKSVTRGPAAGEPEQGSNLWTTKVAKSETTGLTACGFLIFNPVFICIFTAHADIIQLEKVRSQNQSALQSLIILL